MPNKFIPPQTDTVTRSAATPLDGEVFYDTDEKKIYYGDGTTVGGVVVGAGGGGGLTVVYTTDVTLNASANNSYLLSGTTTVNLPVGVNGDRIGFADFDGGFFAAPVTITPNGAETVAGQATLVLDRNHACVELAFWSGNWVITSLESFNAAVGAGHTIEDEGTPLNQRAKLNFVGGGVTVTDDGGNDKTIVTIPANPVTREVLTADRTYYVRTDGSDSNDGLTNTAGGAFLTIQKAIDVAATLDASIYDVTIAFSGAYTVTSSIIIKRPLGSGKLIIDGENNTTSSISSALSNTLDRGLIMCYGHQDIFLRNFKTDVLYPGLWGMHITVARGGNVTCSNLDFGNLPSVPAFASHVISDSNAVVTFDSAYKISGGISGTANQGQHLFARNGGFISTGQFTVTITNTPKFITFAEAESTGIITSYLTTFSGVVLTGCKRYSSTLNSVINQYAAGGTYPYPGSVAGTTATGGQYA